MPLQPVKVFPVGHRPERISSPATLVLAMESVPSPRPGTDALARAQPERWRGRDLVEFEPTQSQKELAERQTLAARICVVVLQNRKPKALGRFAMRVDQLPEATG